MNDVNTTDSTENHVTDDPGSASEGPPRPEKRKPGRPVKVTKAVQDEIVKVIAAGHHKSVACGHVGIHPSTLNRLIADAEEAYRLKLDGVRLSKRERELCAFYIDFAKAEANPEIVAMDVLATMLKNKTAAPGLALKAAIAFLERRFPSRWRRRTAIENAPVGGDNPEPGAPLGKLAIDIGAASDLTEAEVLEQLAAQGYRVVADEG